MDETVHTDAEKRLGLGMDRGRSGDDAPEPEVCGKSLPEALAQLISEGIELSLRSPQGRRDGSGRKSTRRLTSLLVRRRRHRVMR